MTVLRWGSATHVGRVRSQNQDACLEAAPIFAVADGMGGAAGGEVAAHIAIETMRAAARPSEEGLVEGIKRANRAVIARADSEPSLRGMGTTVSAIALVTGDGDSDDGQGSDPTGTGGDRIAVANVGDSRVYLFRDDDLLQVTRDHSLVEDLVEEGRLSEEEARHHPHKNILTRVLGNEDDLTVDTWEVVPYTGDRFLLCSDGLVNEVHDDRIADVLRRVADPQEAADVLVELANEAGGHDNITVLVVDVVDDEGRSARASASLPSPADAEADRSVGPVAGGAAAGGAAGAAAGNDLDAADAAAPGAERRRGRSRRSRRSDGAPGAEPQAARGSRITWRVVAFLVAVMLVLGGAAATVVWYARSGWFVGVAGDDVAIYQGRPGGVLWFDPTLERRTDLEVDELPPARRDAVRAGKEEPSLSAALRYVENLREQAEREERRRAAATTTTTTTTTAPTTTTTAPPPPPPGSP